MPTYQYACKNSECGNAFELVQSFTEPAASECPVCHGPVRKVFSAVGVVFKGSGFYRTDSRAGNSGSPGSRTSHHESAPSSNADSSSSKESSSASSSNGSGGSNGSSDTGSSTSAGSVKPAASAAPAAAS